MAVPDEFDSQVERAFAEKFGLDRDGWRIDREGGFLVHDQKVFVPDFTFRHTDGTIAYLEIVGFWTPEYLRKKWETLALFAGRPILVAVAAKLRQLGAACGPLPDNVITYRTRLKIAPVLERLNAMRDHGQ